VLVKRGEEQKEARRKRQEGVPGSAPDAMEMDKGAFILQRE